MQAILDFLKNIVDTVIFLIDFVIGLIRDIVYLVQLTGKILTSIPSYFSWLPSNLLSLITIVFVVVALYKVLGREG